VYFGGDNDFGKAQIAQLRPKVPMEFKTTDELFQRLPTRDIRVALTETQ
jgi:hypothetical protein